MSLIQTISLLDQPHYHPHFIDDDTEAQGSQVIVQGHTAGKRHYQGLKPSWCEGAWMNLWDPTLLPAYDLAFP